ncbi:MAG: arylesterase [Bdellovibrionales bacterium]|nr:arylesterase [Bdellovibrionales bacterium]
MRFAFLVFAFLFSCAAVAAEFKKLVIIGDSITEGYGVSQDLAYPSLLQKKLDTLNKSWRVVNSGISGSTAASAPSRVSWALKQKPDLIVIALGANDGLRGTTVKSIEENLNAAIKLCKDAKVKVMLAGMRLPPNYGADYTRDFAAVFGRVAKKQGIPEIPFLLENVGGKPELNQADGIHPNEKGHSIVAETVFKAVQKQL